MAPHQHHTISTTTAAAHQRAYSVMAVPSELERHRYTKQQQEKENTHLIWYQEIYKKYGYEPKHRNPSYFGPYLLLQTLGEGEFAKVKAGVHVQTNQEVAIKLMRKDHIKHASLETKLEREISVLKSVQHPHIVKLFEVLTIKNYIGIVLQRAAGGELFDYILKHHYLQETEAKRLFAQLISGVHYMHQKHIVHRDLKLENLLLSKDRDIIITDFGFANRFSIAQEDLMATSCGSPCYAAPELVINDESNYVGTAVDIWSCGVILFAMLCGYLPFDDDPSNPQGANINVLYKYIISTHLEIPKHMSKNATHLLRQMLVPDPSKRCTIDDIRHHPWLKDHQDVLFSDTHEKQHMIISDPRPSSAMILIEDDNKEPDSREEENNCATVRDEDIPSLEVAMKSNTIEEEEEEEEDESIKTLPPVPIPQPQQQPQQPQQQQQQQQEQQIKNTVVDIIPSSPSPPNSNNNNTSSSFLQAKFFSTLQRHASSAPSPPQPKRRPTSASPYINSNKIPNRSQSVQGRDRTHYNHQQQQQQQQPSLHILPSVSEQTTLIVDSSTSKALKSKGQRLMDWFKRKPSSQSTKFNHSNARPTTTARFPLPERPISALPNPIRAMSIGKPLGSYAADFNDSKLRLHRGAVDQDALTSRAPFEVIMSIKESLKCMGIEMKHVSDFKIKCVRPMRKNASTVTRRTTRTRKISAAPFKLFFSSSSATNATPPTNKEIKKEPVIEEETVIYGEQGIDNGDEVQFSVELSKIENLPGLYVVDIKRIRGNIWAFKFLYHTLLDKLDLSGGVGYMAHRRVEDEDEVPTDKRNRISYMTTSSSGSSMMIFEESNTIHIK